MKTANLFYETQSLARQTSERRRCMSPNGAALFWYVADRETATRPGGHASCFGDQSPANRQTCV